MKRGTLFLRVVVFLMGIPILAVCIFLVPEVINLATGGQPEFANVQYSFLIFLLLLYVTAIPFFFALFQTLKILSYIDKNKAFSNLSVKALNYIKYCAIIISILYAAGLPFLFRVAQADDAPGLAALGLIITFASIVIAVFAAVLQKLLKNAIDIKSENDLIV